ARPHSAHPRLSHAPPAPPVRRSASPASWRHALMSATSSPRLRFACLSLAAPSLLAGCAPLIVGGTAATTALVVTDRRTTGEQVEDMAIELKVGAEVRRELGEADNIRVLSHSYAGWVRLVGARPNEETKQRSRQLDSGVEK